MSDMQSEVLKIVDLLKQQAARFPNAKEKSKHEFNFELIVGDFLAFVRSEQYSRPIKMNVGVSWSVGPATRDPEEGDRETESRSFELLDATWTDRQSGEQLSDEDVVAWVVDTLNDWIATNGKAS